MGPGGQIALQGGIDLAGGVVGNLFQKRNIRLQKDANLELANYAYGKDLQMWHTQNLYNSPKAQMQRFREAGLNPNLIYGRGNAGNATAMPKQQQVTAGLRQTKVPTPQVLPMLGQYANIKNTEAQTKNTNQMTDLAEVNTTLRSIDTEMKNAQLAFWQGARDPKTPIGAKSNLNPGKYSFAPMHHKMWMQQDALQNINDLAAKKKNLLDNQIALTHANQLMQMRKYHWYPFERGFGMLNNAVKTGLGAVGVSKLGRSGKFMKQTAPKLRKPSKPKGFNYNNRANRAFSQSVNPY